MTTVFTNTAEGGSNGTAATTGNTGAGSGNAFSSVNAGTGGTVTFSATEKMHGSLSYALTQGTTPNNLVAPMASTTTAAGRWYFRLTGLPSTGSQSIARANNGSAQNFRIDLTSGGAVRVRNSAGTQLDESAGTLSTGTWYRLEWQVTCSATTGTIAVQIHTGDTTGSPVYSYTSGSTDTAASLLYVQIGSTLATPALPLMYVDSITLDNAASVIGPAVTAPTVNAGTDQADKEPGELVTLTATSSESSVGWTQLAGTIVSLSGTDLARTFTAPALSAPETLTFRATATNAGGAAVDEVSVGVLPSTEFVLTAEGWQPLIIWTVT